MLRYGRVFDDDEVARTVDRSFTRARVRGAVYSSAAGQESAKKQGRPPAESLSTLVSPHSHITKIGNARSHHGQVHFHEIILDAARFCRVKDSLPIESALAYRDDLPRFG